MRRHRIDGRVGPSRRTHPGPDQSGAGLTILPGRAHHGHRRWARAFSMVELAASIVVFGVIAAIVTAAIARTSIAGAEIRFERAARAEITSMLHQVTTNTFDVLVNDTFERPSPCPTDDRNSCITAFGRPVTVTWTTETVFAADSDLIEAVRITASATLDIGTTTKAVSVERIVDAPGVGWTPDKGAVEITLLGETWDQPIQLMSAAGRAVAAGEPDNGIVVITAPVTSCTTSAPCWLALTEDGDLHVDGVGFDAATALGPLGQVVLTTGTVTPITATLRAGVPVTAYLEAVNADGGTGIPGVRGSVCLWLTFDDTTGTRSTAACNDELADRVSFRTYSVDGRELLVVAGTYRISTDHPDGTCPAVPGQVVRYKQAWALGNDCTSTVWGPATDMTVAGVPAALTTDIISSAASPAAVTVRWSGAAAVPAAGYTGEPTWNAPRDSAACALTATCAPLTAVPETTLCPGGHCLSSATGTPWVSSPRVGIWRVPVLTAGSGTTTVPVTVRTPAVATVTIAEAPRLGALTFDGNAAGAGYVVSGVVDNQSVDFAYTRSLAGLDAFTIRIEAPTGSREVRIGLNDGATTSFVVTSPGAVIAQGASGSIEGRVFGTDGSVRSGVVVATADLGDGVTAATGTTDASGRVAVPVTVGTATVGLRAASLVAEGVAGYAPLTITPTPTTVGVDSATIAQGRVGAVTITVTDAVGSPAVGVRARLRVTDDGTTVPTVTTARAGCVTGNNGKCAIDLAVDARAQAAVYTVTARSGAVSGTGTLTITPIAGRVITNAVNVMQGATVTTTVTVTDAAGQGVVGSTPVLTAVPGITAQATVTDALGVSTVTISATATTPSGRRDLTVNVGGASGQIPLTVTGSVVSLNGADTTIRQGTTATVVFTALDITRSSVGGVRLGLSNTAGLSHPAFVTTDAAGVARVSVTAKTTQAPGTVSLAVRAADNSIIDWVQIIVERGVTQVISQNSLIVGPAQTLTLRLADASGTAVPGRPVTVTSPTRDIVVTPATWTTSSSGLINVTVTVPAGTAPGIRTLDVTVDGRTLPAVVIIR